MTYFQRALKLNPQYTSAWTLMGHEFMERKNTSAAIEAYRKAIGTKSLTMSLIATSFALFTCGVLSRMEPRPHRFDGPFLLIYLFCFSDFMCRSK